MPQRQDGIDQIASHPAKHLRVLGLPGSGKTSALIERYKSLCRAGTPAFIITFSRQQLRHVTEAILDEGDGHAGLPAVLTYFTLAREVLAASGRVAPRVIEDLEETLLVRRSVGENLRNLKSEFKNIHDSDSFRRELLEVFHFLLQNDIDGDRLTRLEQHNADAALADVLRIFRSYKEGLDTLGAVTYYNIARAAAGACPHLPNDHPLARVRVILVDDFQDIDAGQFELLTALAPPDGAVALNVFGDPMGAYFGFRGTEPRYLIKEFPDRYECETIRVAGRSINDPLLAETLSAIANEVLGGDTATLSPPTTHLSHLGPLFEGAVGEECGDIRVETARDEVEEIYAAAAHAHSLITKGSHRPEDIAIITNDKRRYEPLLRTAFAQRGIAVDTGRPYQNVFRGFVHSLLSVVSRHNDGVAMQALVTSPFYPYLSRHIDARRPPETFDIGRESQRVARVLQAVAMPVDSDEQMKHIVEEWLRPACDDYYEDAKDESPFAFLSLMSKRWSEYQSAADSTGHKATIGDFVGSSGLFREKTTAPMPSSNEIGFYSCKEAKGQFFRSVIVLGCSELLFPSALRRETIMPVRALQTLTDTALPELGVRAYGARTPLEHLHDEYHLLYHSLTRAHEYMYVLAPKRFFGQDHPAPAEILRRTLPASVVGAVSPGDITPPQIRFAREWVDQAPTPNLADRLEGLSRFGQVWNREKPVPEEFAIERFPLSKSSLERYLKCPRLFFYEKVLRVPQEDTEALLVGNLFHRVMARIGEHYKTKSQMHDAIDDTVIRSAIDDVMEGERTKGLQPDSFFCVSLVFHLEMMVRGTLRLDKKESDDYTVTQIEERFALDHKGWEFRGQFDRVEQTGAGGSVLDYKTGEFNKTAGNLRDRTLDSLDKPDRANWQVPIYVWAYRDAANELPDAIRHLVQAPSKAPFFVTLYIRRRPEDIPPTAASTKRVDQAFSYLMEHEVEAIMDRAVEHAEDVFAKRVRFEKTDNLSQCRNCVFNRLCDRRTD